MSKKDIAIAMEERLLNAARSNAEKIRVFYQEQAATDLKNYEEVLHNEVALYMEKELADLKDTNALLNAKASMELRNELFHHRQEKVDQLFSEIEQQLRDFAASEQYPEFLKYRWQQCQAVIGSTEGWLAVRAADEAVISGITGSLPAKPDPRIKLGGFVWHSQDGRREVDMTLDQALRDQRVQFEETSQLVL